jgi:uncharacterized OB-fold protein
VSERGELRAGLVTRECRRCGQVVFPPRPLCPRCAASDWTERLAERGVVEAVTWRGERQLASVRTDAGPVVTALAPGGDLEPGIDVALESRLGAGATGEGVQVRAVPLHPRAV